MKKTFLFFAALFAATFVSAQITLEKTFETKLYIGTEVQQVIGQFSTEFPLAIGPYIVSKWYDDSWEYFYDVYDFKTLTLLRPFSDKDLTGGVQFHQLGFISRGIFTTDNRWAWAYSKYNDSTRDNPIELFIVTEDHAELLHIPACNSLPTIMKGDDLYKLSVTIKDGNDYITQIYSLPGKGDSGQDISSPAAPHNSRKVLKKDQVLVESADRTYTLQGQEVK